MEENNILLKDYIKSNFTKEQIEKDLITLYDDKKHPNLLFKPMEPLKNFCRDNKEWAEWEVVKELNIKSWKDTSIHEISIKPSKTLINMTKSYLTVEQYCIKNSIKDKDLKLYRSKRQGYFRFVYKSILESFLLQEGKKWLVVEEIDIDKDLHLLVKDNLALTPTEEFKDYIIRTWKVLSEGNNSLIKFNLSLVYNNYFEDFLLNVYIYEGFVDFYRTYVHGIQKERLTIEKRFDEDYIVFDIGSKERGQEVYLLTKKETFFKEGGDIDWIDKKE